MKIIKPEIFPKSKIISGVTLKNLDLFEPFGFSISKTNIYSDSQILKMHEKFAEFLGYKLDYLIFQKQIHSDIISIVNDDYQIVESDAMICNLKGRVLNVKLADCGGILLYDPVKSVIAVIHSGWRGSAANILTKTILRMKDEFNSLSADLLAYIAPLASVKNYQVGNDVQSVLGKFCIKSEDGSWYFDNRLKLKEELLSAGVNFNNIEISDLCTIENPELHSYRRDNENSGRMSCYICIV